MMCSLVPIYEKARTAVPQHDNILIGQHRILSSEKCVLYWDWYGVVNKSSKQKQK